MLYFISIKYFGGSCELKLNRHLVYESKDGSHNFSTLANVWMNHGENVISLILKGSERNEHEEVGPALGSCELSVFGLTDNSEKEFIYEHTIATEEIQIKIKSNGSYRSEGDLKFEAPEGVSGLLKPWITDITPFQKSAYDAVKRELLGYFVAGDSGTLMKSAGVKIGYLSQLFEEPMEALENELQEHLQDFFRDFLIHDGEHLSSLTTYQKIHDCGIVRLVDMKGNPGLAGLDTAGVITSGFEIYLARTKEGIRWVF